MAHWTLRLLKHRMLDEGDAQRLLEQGRARTHRGARRREREAPQRRDPRRRRGGLPLSYLRRGATPRERAVALFGKLGVWDTERNNGVLIYLLLAERAIEIVADRGLNRHVPAAEWAEIAATMKSAFQERDFEGGLLRAVDAVDALLVRHFAAQAGDSDVNELPDAPLVR